MNETRFWRQIVGSPFNGRLCRSDSSQMRMKNLLINQRLFFPQKLENPSLLITIMIIWKILNFWSMKYWFYKNLKILIPIIIFWMPIMFGFIVIMIITIIRTINIIYRVILIIYRILILIKIIITIRITMMVTMMITNIKYKSSWWS